MWQDAAGLTPRHDDEPKPGPRPGQVEPLTPPPAGEDPEARDVLRRQARLLDLEISNFNGRLRIARSQGRLKIVTQLLAVLSALAVAVALGSMVVSAIRSRAVVVDAFDSPAVLAERGLTGPVVAGRVLDALTVLKSATRTAAARRETVSAWSQDIKVQVPQTGVSLGEIDRLLRARLGRDTHVGGDLVQLSDGRLALTVRGDKTLPRTFVGPADGLDDLARAAAEHIYGSSEPVLFGIYLSQSGRTDEALAFLQAAYPEARPEDRTDMLNTWGMTLQMAGKRAEAVARYRQALQIDPYAWKAWANLIRSLEAVEGPEAVYRTGLQMLAADRRAPPSRKIPAPYRGNFANYEQDWARVIAASEADAAANGGGRTSLDMHGPMIANAAARLHDWAQVDRALLASDPNDDFTRSMRLELAAERAIEAGDPARALKLMETHYAAYGDSCLRGRAYMAAGQADQAEAAFAFPLIGALTYECRSWRADLPALRGDGAASLAAHAAAAQAAPSLAFPRHRWGLALVREGRPAEAIAQFAAAHRQAPAWADPLKAWGDVLAAQGRPVEARRKYAEALERAPQWPALIEAARRSD